MNFFDEVRYYANPFEVVDGYIATLYKSIEPRDKLLRNCEPAKPIYTSAYVFETAEDAVADALGRVKP